MQDNVPTYEYNDTWLSSLRARYYELVELSDEVLGNQVSTVMQDEEKVQKEYENKN